MIASSKIFDKQDVSVKIKRLAYQIIEDFYNESEIYLIGIAGGGEALAELLQQSIQEISTTTTIIHRIELNKKKPLSSEITLSVDATELRKKVVILVDDVSNSGRTLFYALTPFMEIDTKTVKVAVLIDRKHKRFPIECNYVGNSLNTTIKEHIDVKFSQKEIEGIYLN